MLPVSEECEIRRFPGGRTRPLATGAVDIVVADHLLSHYGSEAAEVEVASSKSAALPQEHGALLSLVVRKTME